MGRKKGKSNKKGTDRPHALHIKAPPRARNDHAKKRPARHCGYSNPTGTFHLKVVARMILKLGGF